MSHLISLGRVRLSTHVMTLSPRHCHIDYFSTHYRSLQYPHRRPRASVITLLKNACMDLDEMLRADRCRDMDELINV